MVSIANAESAGSRANSNGRTAEDIIAGVLAKKGVLAHRQYQIGRSIYGGGLVTDFFIEPTARFPEGLAIESKWQEVSGTAEEKLPYLVENIRTQFPCPVIVIVGGGGARGGAVSWLRRQVDGYKLIHVFAFEEFVTWTNRSL